MSQRPTFAPLLLTPLLDELLRGAATLAISVSGGKDSQALLNALMDLWRNRHYPGRVFAIHADLGRAEWQQTPEHVARICADAGVDLQIVQRAKGDLVTRFEERIEALAGTDTVFWPDAQNRYCTSHLKGGPIDIALRATTAAPADDDADFTPFWPDAQNRYCTSDLKRGPIDGALRQYADVIISAEGVRADESRERAKKPGVEVRVGITAGSKVNPARDLRAMSPEAAIAARQPGQRVALNWRPLLHWTTAQVWEACGTTAADLAERQRFYRLGAETIALHGWPGHPAYVFGNERLSCALCVLGSKRDLTNGANHNPDTYGLYLRLEVIGDATFKHKQSLFDLPVSGAAARVRDEVLAECGRKEAVLV